LSPSPSRAAGRLPARLVSGLDRVATWAARTGGIAIGISAILVSIDVILRKVAGITLGAMDEITGYIFIVATSWSFAFALIRRSHIRIDTLYVWFPAKVQIVLDLVCMTVMAGFGSVLLWYAWQTVSETIRMGSIASTPLRTPLAIPQIPWLGGLLFFAITAVILLVVLFICLFQGRRDLIRLYGGAPSLIDEVDDLIDEATDYSQSGKT